MSGRYILVALAVFVVSFVSGLAFIKPTPEPRHVLTTSVDPAGSGSIVPVEGTFDYGEQVTLTAKPASGYRFDRWDGDVIGNANPVTVSMNSDKKVIAYFIAPAPTPTPVPTPAPDTPKPSFEDDFSNTNSGWSVESDESGEWAYENGEYSLLVKKTDWMIWSRNKRIVDPSDFTVEFDVRKLSQGNGEGCGVVFREQRKEDTNNLYRFQINSSDGTYKIDKLLEGEWTILREWIPSSYIKGDVNTNRLKVVCRGEQIEVYVNGYKLDTVNDASLTNGRIGLMVSSPSELTGSHFHFDNFKLYVSTGEALTPPPTSEDYHFSAYSYTPSDFRVNRAMKHTMDIITERTDGQITFDFQEQGQINPYDAVCERKVDIAYVPADACSPYTPSSTLFQIPGLIPDAHTMQDGLDHGVAELIRLEWDAKEGKVIAFFPLYSVDIATNSCPVILPDDLKGLKIRLTDDITAACLKSSGATPVRLPSADVYEALQLGVIDGQWLTTSTFGNMDWNEVTEYYTWAHMMHPLAAIFMNKEALGSLPPDLDKIFTEAWSKDYVSYYLKLMDEEQAEAKRIAQRDCKFHETIPEERKVWYEKLVEPVLNLLFQEMKADQDIVTKAIDIYQALSPLPAPNPEPDLIIPDITWSLSNPPTEETVTFTTTIKNQGSSKAESFSVYYYIDGGFNASDDISSIPAGGTVTKIFTWAALPGTHTIKIVADFHGEVIESDESNNEKTVTFSTDYLPDLIVKAITWSPENPSKGDTVTFSITVKNQGNARAGTSRVHFYIDDHSRGENDVQGIDAGATTTNTFVWTAQAGSHTIKAIADYYEKVIESDEDNNGKIVTIQPLPPDLVIEAITWSPEDPSERDNVTFTVTIKNQGSSRADYSTVAYYIDDTFVDSASVNRIDAATTDTKTFEWTAQAGSHTVKAIADYYEKVIESDEDNNVKAIIFPTLAPDFVVQDITWSPLRPSVGEAVTFTVTIKNQGSARAYRARIFFYVDEIGKGIWEVQLIGVDDSVTIDFTWTAQAGSHEIKAVVDKDNLIIETDESNNEKKITFSDTNLPDLIVQDVAWSPPRPSIGETVTFSVAIKNQGSGKADFSYVAYYVDDTFVASASVSPLDSGATNSKTFEWTAQAGTHVIKVVADKESKIPESDENNNELTVIYPASPDLVIESVTWLPENPSENDNVTFTVTIKNQGSDRADYTYVAYSIDNAYPIPISVSPLGSGDIETKTFGWIAQEGSHTIKAIADYNEDVIESDENNNEKAVIFSLAPS